MVAGNATHPGLEFLPVCKIAGFPGLDYSESIIDGKGIRFGLRFLLWLGCYWNKSSYNAQHKKKIETFLGGLTPPPLATGLECSELIDLIKEVQAVSPMGAPKRLQRNAVVIYEVILLPHPVDLSF